MAGKSCHSKSVLVPIDHRENCIRAFDWYLENYGSEDQRLVLLHVYSSLENVEQCASDNDSDEVTNIRDDDMKKIFKAAEQQAKAMLEPFEDKCKKKKISFKTRIEFGSPGEAICEVARDEQVTCILLGNRGLGAFRRRILGSVSDHVVHHSKIPVIIVPPKGP